MPVLTGLRIVSYFFAFALLLQCFEMIFISRHPTFLKIWSFQNIQNSFPFFKSLFAKMYTEKGFQNLLYLQLALILSVFFYFNPLIIFLIALIQLIICLRFRGNFNGGSDMMAFVIATGLIIGGKLGLIYIAIHTCYSYFKAGLVKVVQPNWRSGLAVKQFLGVSLYPLAHRLQKKLNNCKSIFLFLGISTLTFEISLPIIFAFPNLVYFYCAVAVFFHVFIYVLFGLNRFLWIWVAAWPAVIFGLDFIKF